jgi:hypothetical protein
MSVPRQDCDSTIDLLNLSRDQLIKRVLALMRENERLQGEIRRSTDEVADLQFQLLRYQTPALTGWVDARCVTSPPSFKSFEAYCAVFALTSRQQGRDQGVDGTSNQGRSRGARGADDARDPTRRGAQQQRKLFLAPGIARMGYPPHSLWGLWRECGPAGAHLAVPCM